MRSRFSLGLSLSMLAALDCGSEPLEPSGHITPTLAPRDGSLSAKSTPRSFARFRSAEPCRDPSRSRSVERQIDGWA